MTSTDLQRLAEPIAARADDLPWTPLANRRGIMLRNFPFCRPDVGIRLRASIGKLEADLFSPRHKHTFDQVRYMLRGTTMLGDVLHAPGDCGYFPEGVEYGPQAPYDDRTALQITLQFPGPAQIFYPSPEEQDRAVAELSEVGRFERGRYLRDGTDVDSFEALLTHLTGTPTSYPAARFDEPVLVHCAEMDWAAGPLPGVARKYVGCFTEVGPHIELLRLGPGQELAVATGAYQEMRFVVDGELTYQGQQYPAVSGFYCPSYLGFAPMRSTSGAQVLVVRIAEPGGVLV
jgi:hypothetical protein